jgi:hypothetical protein
MFKLIKNLNTLLLIKKFDSPKSNLNQLLKKIEKTSIQKLNASLLNYYKEMRIDDYKRDETSFTVLEAILTSQNDIVLKAFLEKNKHININFHNPLIKLINRDSLRENQTEEKRKITLKMANMLINAGLDINWSEMDKNENSYNYLNRILNKYGKYELSNKVNINYELLDLLLKNEILIQDKKGELIFDAITIGNEEIINKLLTIKNINIDYIEKGLNLYIKYKNYFLNEPNVEIMGNYIARYIEVLTIKNEKMQRSKIQTQKISTKKNKL